MDKYKVLEDSISEKKQGVLTELQGLSEIAIPQSAFGKGRDLDLIEVLYISDIHIEAHMLSLGIDVRNKNAVYDYASNLVNKLIDEQIVNEITRDGVSPNNMKELLMGFYYIFFDETSDMTKKERDELECKLYSKEINIPVESRLQKCIIIDGDLADNLETAEIFFECMQKRIRSLKSYDNKCCPIYYVLGNHEYSEYNNVKEANELYKERLKEYGVIVLSNETLEFGNCIIYGGTGFAKYNLKYNSDNLVGPKDMFKNRDKEACESDKASLEYKNALDKASCSHKPLIVISHYPLKDWLSGQVDAGCYYFTGHDHVNTIIKVNNSYIYADNQIGYDSNDIEFKSALIATRYNPFIDFEDGIHEITPKQYSDFYKYTGEYVGIGIIKKQLTGNAKFYLIKQNGFLGFFIINDKNTKICAGGRVKVVSQITDIRYFYECFSMMIYQYVAALLPLRKYQEKLSEMIKSLNIPYYDSGRIHGCIVDVDFYHHIMINPYDGRITFYYSPYFGLVQKFESFGLLLDSMEKQNYWLKRNTAYIEAKKQIGQHELIKEEGKGELRKYQLESLDIKNSLYGLSMKVNQLQRLFTSNILRDWDNTIIEDLVGKETENKNKTGK